MKTILVPTDFSRNADNALEYAITLAAKGNARLIIVHGYLIHFLNTDIPTEDMLKEIALAKTNADNRLELLRKKVEARRIDCEIINREEAAVDLIIDIAEKRKPDLIVMGTKGATGVFSMIMRTNTAKVIEKVKCSVIAVPDRALVHPVNHIIYATDYDENDLEILKRLIDTAKLFNANITILHVCLDADHDNHAEERSMDHFSNKVRAVIDYERIDFRLIYGQHLVNALEEYIEKESPDLLAMFTHKHNLFGRVFAASSTRKMAHQTRIPLLALHYEEEPVILID